MTQKLLGGILDSSCTSDCVRQCQEPESLIQFFPKGFKILNGKRMSMADAHAKAKEGSLYAVMAPYGEGARVIQQKEVDSARLNPHHVYVAVFGDDGYLWKGSKSCEVEQKFAVDVAAHYQCPNKHNFNEG